MLGHTARQKYLVNPKKCQKFTFPYLLQVNEDLRAAERAFNDVHKKYERTKEAIGEFKRNEDALKVHTFDSLTFIQKNGINFHDILNISK